MERYKQLALPAPPLWNSLERSRKLSNSLCSSEYGLSFNAVIGEYGSTCGVSGGGSACVVERWGAPASDGVSSTSGSWTSACTSWVLLI